jgi:hypothetical protein
MVERWPRPGLRADARSGLVTDDEPGTTDDDVRGNDERWVAAARVRAGGDRQAGGGETPWR